MKNLSNRSFFLLACDMLAVAAAYALGIYFRVGFFDLSIIKIPSLYFSFVAFPFLFYLFDLYYPYRRFVSAQTAVDILLGVSIGMLTSAAAAYADRSLILPRLIFIYTTLSLIPLVLAIRFFYDFFFRSHWMERRVLVVGTGGLALEIVRVIQETPHSGMEVIGMVSEARKPAARTKNGVPIAGAAADIVSLIDWYRAHLVVLAMESKEDSSEAKVMADMLERQVPVTSAIHLFEQLSGDFPYKLLGKHYLIGLMSQVRTRPYLKLKRVIDLAFGSLILIALLPVLFVAVILLAFTGPGKIFFLQERIGKDGVPFRLIKLRSMMEKKNGRPKVTLIGRWIRRYRIDEIPQLLNVLGGDMSLIGPRPEIPYFVTRCRKKIPFYDTVFALKPGLTGWAQVKFRHTTTVKEYDLKFRYNLYYLKNISLTLDLLILLKTIRVVLFAKGS